ncbi:MAG: hypothetical protein F6K26_46605 [Moorea sp. SIO2I5]|nr:hypothetical protein [Moorena sp. SIO2I5]
MSRNKWQQQQVIIGIILSCVFSFEPQNVTAAQVNKPVTNLVKGLKFTLPPKEPPCDCSRKGGGTRYREYC